MPRASSGSSVITSALSKPWLCGKSYLHANKLYSFSFINCACLRGALAFCSEREKPQSHSPAYTSAHRNRKILSILSCCGGTRKLTEFYHSIPAGHRSPQLSENEARQPLPKFMDVQQVHTLSHKITQGESCISTCLQQKHEKAPETIPGLLSMEKC